MQSADYSGEALVGRRAEACPLGSGIRKSTVLYAGDTSTCGRAPKAGYPLLCLRHLQSGWGFEELTSDQCQEFLLKWSKRAQINWTELVQHQRHGLGWEKLPKWKIKPAVPEHLEADAYIAFRHQGNLPFVGFRSGDIFHVLWIERRYNDLYDH